MKDLFLAFAAFLIYVLLPGAIFIALGLLLGYAL
jgi:hypothetical protein